MAQTGQTITYGQLEESSNQVAHLFRNLGLNRGDHVALCLENHPAFLTISWAAYRAGLYLTAISYRLQSDEVEFIVNDCGAKLLITSFMLSDTFDQFKDKLVNNPICYMIDGTVEGSSSFEEAISNLPVSQIVDQSYGQSMLYSSGTTGKPKGVKKPLIETPWGDEVPTFVPARDRYQFDTHSIYLSPAPLYHAAPLGFNMNVLRYGGTCIVMENYDAVEALRLIQEFKITHSQWVPTMFVRMLKLPEDVTNQFDTSSMKFAVHAAAPCPVEIKERMIKWWGPIIY
jgi:long-chain acyl-CoA synthetase